MRLIDADDLLTAFPAWENEIFRTSAVRGTINACPTVDAVPRGAYDQVRWERDIAMQQLETLGYELGEKVIPVVRCKDCKYWRGRKYNKHINGFLPWCGFSALQREADEFCSHGKRKDGDECG